MAQSGSALAWGASGRRFKSGRPDQRWSPPPAPRRNRPGRPFLHRARETVPGAPPGYNPARRRGVAQSGRAPGSGSGGRRFKSCRPDAARSRRDSLPAPRVEATGQRRPVGDRLSGDIFRQGLSAAIPRPNRIRTGYPPPGPGCTGASKPRFPLRLDNRRSTVMDLSPMFALSNPNSRAGGPGSGIAPGIARISPLGISRMDSPVDILPLEVAVLILSARLTGAMSQRPTLSCRR